MKKIIQYSLCAGLVSALALTTQVTNAGAFQLWEESASGTGDYHAGGAAEADDASTEFYNPAGMVRLKKQQISAGGVLIPAGVKFKGIVNSSPTNGWVSGGTFNAVPNLHYVIPFRSRFAFGFGVTAPFGLSTDYPSTGAVSFAATKTQIKTINLNPNFAIALNKMISIGLGFDVMYGEATYNNMISGFNANFTNHLSDWATGYNLGLLLQFSSNTRFGVSYRSEISLHGSGKSQLSNGVQTNTTTVSALLNMPATTMLSVFQNINNRWSLMASAFYTQWNVFSNLVLNNTSLPSPQVVVNENFHNTWNFALGTKVKVRRITLMLGTGYDQTPTTDGYRDVRLPDADRIALATGIQFPLFHHSVVSLGYVHLFAWDAKINNKKNSQSTNIPTQTGTAKMNVNIFGAQYTLNL